MDIRQIETLLVEDRYYLPEFVSHFLKYAINLKSVTFDNRARFKISFIQMFLVINQKCIFYVPAPLRGETNASPVTSPRRALKSPQMKVLGKEKMEESTFIKSELERGGGTYKQ
jgi:hypothetical protein